MAQEKKAPQGQVHEVERLVTRAVEFIQEDTHEVASEVIDRLESIAKLLFQKLETVETLIRTAHGIKPAAKAAPKKVAPKKAPAKKAAPKPAPKKVAAKKAPAAAKVARKKK